MTPDDLEPLSADLTSLLDAEKPITAAPAGAKAKLLARLSADLFDAPGGDGGGEGSDGSGGGAAPSTPSGGGLGTSAGTGVVGATSGVVAKAVVAKLVVGASIASLAVGGAIGAGVHSAVTTPPPAPPPIVRSAPVEPPPPPVVPVVEPPPSAPLVEVSPPPVEPAPVKAPPKVSADEQLALEKSYVEQARAAMARKDVDAALDALAQHEKRFPRGQLTEERLALKVMALSSAGRSIDAKIVAREFRQRFPTGLFRSAVDSVSPE